MATIAEAYGRTMDFLRGRKRAYSLTFQSPAGNEVLIDLAKFCRAAETCVVPGDNDLTRVLEGRREVWLRIQQQLNLSSEELFQLGRGQRVSRLIQGDPDA